MEPELPPGMQLANELAQAILTNDGTAVRIAAVNIVGNFLDSLGTIAAAQTQLAISQARIAESLDSVIIRKETIHTYSVD